MKKTLGVIADDLSGAMDTGVQILKKGIGAGVIFDAVYLDKMSKMADVIVVDTESRNIDVKSAYQKVGICVDVLRDKGINLIYKKIDSTLRGNIGGELSAVLDSGIADIVLAAPALPFNGRTTINGIHYVNGRKLEETELAHDPFSPVLYSYIPDIINMQTTQKVAVIPISTIRSGRDEIKRSVKEIYSESCKIFVADAVDENDLNEISKVVFDLNGIKVLPCGSAGLFEHIGCRICECFESNISNKQGIKYMNSASNKKPVIIISGSPANMTKKQIEYAGKMLDNIEVFRINNITGLDTENILGQILISLKSNKNIIIDGAGESKETLLAKYGKNKERLFCESIGILNTLGYLAKCITDCFFDIGGLILLGGDTAINICKALGVWGIILAGELEPYVPEGMLMLEEERFIRVATKAGGFGKEDTLVNIIKKFS